MTTPGSIGQVADKSLDRGHVSARAARQVVRASYESSAVTFQQYAEKVINYAESATETARRELTQRRIDMLRDAWGPLLKAALDNWVTDEVKDLITGTQSDHLDLSRNPAKHIWHTLSVLYKLPPKRTTIVNGEESKDAERYADLLEDTDFDTWWKLVELLLNTCNEVVIWPSVVTRNGEKVIRHRVGTGATMTAVAVPDDNDEIECWVIIDEFTDLDGQQHVRYRLWTDDWTGEFEWRTAPGNNGETRRTLERTDQIDEELHGEDEETEDGKTVMNPYGRLHFHRIRLMPWPDLIWDETSGEDLVDLTVHNGINRAFYRYLEKVAGFKQLLASGNFDKPVKQLLNPGFLLMLQGEDITTTVVDWQVDLLARLKCMDTDEQAAAAAKGINPQLYKRDTDYQTATSAKNAERGLAEYREHNIPIMAKAERAHFRNVCLVAEKNRIASDRIPNSDAKLMLEFQPLAYAQDPLKQLETIARAISLSLESAKTALAKLHPEWTEEQVTKHLDKVLEDIAQVNDMKTRHEVPDNPENQSAGAEEDGAKGPVIRDGGGSPPGLPPGKPLRAE